MASGSHGPKKEINKKMKKLALISSLVLGVAAMATAAQTTPPSSEKTHKAAPKQGTRHTVAGEIVAVDTVKSTVTFKSDKGEQTWPVNAKAQAALKELKAGDKVTIGYAADEKGEPKEATSIAKAHPRTPPKK
jgi:hypothetical protein